MSGQELQQQLQQLQEQNLELRRALEAAVEAPRVLQQQVEALRAESEEVKGMLKFYRPPSSSFKCPLPAFSGDQDVESWVIRMELAAEAMGMTPDNLARASFLTALRGSALIFIETHPDAQKNWVLQKSLLQAHYVDDTKSITLRGKLRNLHMVGSNLEGFYREFMQIVNQITPPLSKEEIFDKFFFQLPSAVRERVLQHKALTLEPALEVARRYYSEAVAAGQSFPSHPVPMELDRLRRQGGHRGGKPTPPVSQGSGEVVCYGCGGKGHKRFQCPARNTVKGPEPPKRVENKKTNFSGKGHGSSRAGPTAAPKK